MSNIYGYVRVSTKEQNEDRQMIAMREMGVPEKNIYMDKQSGKDFDRPQYHRLVRRMKKDEIFLAVWIQSHDSFENEPPFEYPLNPLFSNRYRYSENPADCFSELWKNNQLGILLISIEIGL